MTPSVMIALVGEQPIPNLIAVRHDKPSRVVLVHTQRTEQVSGRLAPLLRTEVDSRLAHPYEVAEILRSLREFVLSQGWRGPEMSFNLTGGTKPMALAAYGLAQELGSPFAYFQSEGARNLVYRYEFRGHCVEFAGAEEVSTVLNIDDHLQAYLPGYKDGLPRYEFEKLVSRVLRPEVDEIKTSITYGGALEIDLVVRCGNHIGIAEVKSGQKAKEKRPIEQLTAATEQRLIGTYVVKFLILDRPLEHNNRALAEAHGMRIIELPSAAGDSLSEDDERRLVSAVRSALGG